MPEAPTPGGVPDRLVRATITLLAEQGPSAIKARDVASAAGMSSMVVYSHFGGVPELIRAVVDHGFLEMERAFSTLPVTDDPIADLFTMALTTRDLARGNPHLYDLMFGLSTRATYRPVPDKDVRRSGHSPAFQAVNRHLLDASARLAASDRVSARDADVVAAALWSMVHGYVTLELGDHFTGFKDPVLEVLVPMGVTFAVGLGDTPERAQASHASVLAVRRQTGPQGGRAARSGRAPRSRARG
jgi:AcrR family transcriptional regulator